MLKNGRFLAPPRESRITTMCYTSKAKRAILRPFAPDPQGKWGKRNRLLRPGRASAHDRKKRRKWADSEHFLFLVQLLDGGRRGRSESRVEEIDHDLDQVVFASLEEMLRIR